MAATIPNGTIPTVTGGVPQSSNIYPQQQQQRQFNNTGPGNIRNPNEEQCKIFVGGVGKNTNDESLRAYFSKFGQIADSVIMQDRETGEPRGFAFVTFTTPEAVAAVIEQRNNGGHTLDGKMIDPKPAVRQGPGQRAAFGNNMVKPMPQNPMYKGPMNVAEELKIFVGGIGIGTTEDDVKNYFSTFGEVVAVNMPYHQVYKCPKGFAFVGFKSTEVVASVIKDRYHQINGKTVEVKGADEQQQHLRKKQENRYSNPHHTRAPLGTIGTIGGGVAGAGFANIATAGTQQVLIPQVINGQTQYVAAQIPAAPQPAPQQYVFDPATNTYYQLPATTQILGAAGAAGAYNPYAGMQIMASAAAGTTAGSPLAAAGMAMSAAALAGAGAGAASGAADATPGGQLGAVYTNETSSFGPARSHVLDGGHQPIAGGAGGATDPQVVYSNAGPHSGGESVPSRGYHPYGR